MCCQKDKYIEWYNGCNKKQIWKVNDIALFLLEAAHILDSNEMCREELFEAYISSSEDEIPIEPDDVHKIITLEFKHPSCLEDKINITDPVILKSIGIVGM